eukprot:2569041-Rhodomonas_salina.1
MKSRRSFAFPDRSSTQSISPDSTVRGPALPKCPGAPDPGPVSVRSKPELTLRLPAEERRAALGSPA